MSQARNRPGNPQAEMDDMRDIQPLWASIRWGTLVGILWGIPADIRWDNPQACRAAIPTVRPMRI